ncbi:hypothetical protein [Rhodopirellula baltica]
MIVVAFILGGVMVLLYRAVQATRHPDGPLGSAFPTELPDELRRHQNITRVSMVLPPNWVENEMMTEMHRRYPDGDHIWYSAIPRTTPGRRPNSAIDVRFLAEPIHEINDDFTRCEFNGLPAFERTYVNNSIGDPYVSEYLLYVNQDDGWWFIQYSTDRRRLTSLPDGVRRYVETIRLPQRKAANHPMQPSGEVGRLEMYDQPSPPADRQRSPN